MGLIWAHSSKISFEVTSRFKGCSGTCPVNFVISLRMEMPQTLQVPVPVFDTPHPQGRKDFLILRQNLPCCDLCLCLVSYYGALPRRVWHLLCTLSVGSLKHLHPLLNLIFRLNKPSSVSFSLYVQPPGAPRVSFQYVNIRLVQRNPKQDTVLQAGSHKCQAEGKNDFPQPAGYSLACTAQDVADVRADSCWSCCLLGHPEVFLENCFATSWYPTCPAAQACSVSGSGISVCLC